MSEFRIMVLVNGLSPYRLDYFQELGKYCELKVVCERRVAEDRSWRIDTSQNLSFSLSILKGIATTPDTAFCPNVLIHLLKQRYDLVIVANYSTLTGMLAIACLKTFSINFAIECDGGIKKNGKGFKEILKKKLISSAKWWFSPSDITDEYLEFYGARRANIFRYPFTSIKKKAIVDNPICIREKKEIRRALDINEKKIIVSIGQFIKRKGFDILINASQYFGEEIGVYIIGGKATDEYIEQINRLKLKNIHFIEFMNNEKLSQFYKAADVFVLPTREDIWGLVVNEAMAYGLPIVTTDNCGAGLELVKDYYNGFIVPVGDTMQLAEKIKLILNNDVLNESMSKKSLEKIAEYTIENMAIQHMYIFEKIIKN